MPVSKRNPSTPRLGVQAAGLMLFGVALQRALDEASGWIPREVYWEASYTAALVFHHGIPALLACSLGVLAVWVLTPAGPRRLGWHWVDDIGGLRWVCFVVMAGLTWSFAGHAYNYYYDQAHVWDRWLLILLMGLALRSPFLLLGFLLQMVLSRAQVDHPINSPTSIGEELPIRALGIVFGVALWNLGSARLGRGREGTRHDLGIGTPVAVFAILCSVASYYVYAGFSKLWAGVTLTDWVRFNHLENLFVASYQNGWLPAIPEATLLSLAEAVRSFSLPASLLTVVAELGMILVWGHRWGTLVVLLLIGGMHGGIFLLSGICFWKWLLLEGALVLWLWFHREASGVQGLYSPARWAVSVVLIGASVLLFGQNRFTWWNTKLTTILQVEVLDAEGGAYVVDHAAFSPYVLFDYLDPEGAVSETQVYGMTDHQELMQRFEALDPDDLREVIRRKRERARGRGASTTAEKIAFNDFAVRYFQHRNENPGRRVAPFYVSPPMLHTRKVRASNVYRDQAPIVRVWVRYIEVYYNGSSRHPISNDVIHAVRIPRSLAGTASRGPSDPIQDRGPRDRPSGPEKRRARGGGSFER